MLPVHKKTKHRKRTRRSHHALDAVHLISCPKCGQAKLPHGSCGSCGYVNSHTSVKLENAE